ncbi:MAG: NAD(P)/FAD-dependent oxidoreductase [Kofleriaceae bacterium]|nr:NAD(P)/FAD-dependent oxidoreductase [Candidatus Methylomirabilis lanthanidiphila]
MKRVVVIGAGAAGTMAAIFAASSGAETLLLERTKDGGRKILMSGGGRCNILPAVVHESRFVTDSSPHTLRKMLRSWPLSEQIAFFEGEVGRRGVRESRSHRRWRASVGDRSENDGKQDSQGAVSVRRDTRRLRTDRRLQLLLGVGDGARGRPRRITHTIGLQSCTLSI